MFALSVLIGIYSYGIFTLGVLYLLTPTNITAFSVSWLFIIILYLIGSNSIPKSLNFISTFRKTDRISQTLLLLLLVSAVVNLLGALGPELGFDALWYHLSLPKIWLLRESIGFIPGPVFKYSVMPKLTELLYTAVLALFTSLPPKIIHYLFGLLTLVPLYQLSRPFLSRNYSLLVLVLFYSNLVVGWESTSAYVDLTRTFFEILALQLFITRKYTHSAVALGLAISTKLVALSSLVIFILLLLSTKETRTKKIIASYLFFSMLIPLPWLLFSYLSTGNPFYPLFSTILGTQIFSLNPRDLWQLFTQSADPISPVYIITAPLLFIQKNTRQGRGVIQIFIYAVIALLIWYISPRSGGARFILPYLPAFSLLSVILISNSKDILVRRICICLILFLSAFSLLYRFVANYKNLPVILGRQTSTQFLQTRLNYNFGDYIDIDNFLTQNISSSDVLLIAGINNVYYLPAHLKFIHLTELLNPHQLFDFNYLLIRQTDTDLIPNSGDWKIIHSDPITHTLLYRKI